MENSLERLEQIMKPYFDKKEEIETLSNANSNEASEVKDEIAELRAKRKEERIKLELRLERLRANKDKEIEEYVLSQPSFYAGYAATVRKDLEQAYKAQEEDLMAEIKEFNKRTEDEIKAMENLKAINSRVNYNRVYLREMIDLKNSLRKSLIAEQKEITFALQREKINFDSVMLELSNFKYQYNDQHQVTNGLEWKELFEKSNQISSKMNELRNSLKVVEEYLNLTELTEEEKAVAMSGLTSWEKEEYNRRNGINVETLITENNDTTKVEEVQPVEITEEVKELPVVEETEKEQENTEEQELPKDDSINNDDDIVIDVNPKVPEDLIDTYTPLDIKPTVEEDQNNNLIVDNLDELSKLIYHDILKETESMSSIKLDPSSNPAMDNNYYFSSKDGSYKKYNYDGIVSLDEEQPIALPNGEFINSNDINNALKNFYKKNKGQSVVVREINKTLTVSKKQIRKLKKALKQCSIVRLLQDKKISDTDVKLVYGKEYGKKTMVKIGNVSTLLPKGDYILKDELLVKFENIFTSKEKRLEWLKKLSNRVRNLRKNNEDQVDEFDATRDDETLTEQEEVVKQI